jgi:hypothetical protein
VHRQPVRGIATGAAAWAAVACCSSASAPSGAYDPDIPASWAASVTHPFFPLVPGTTHEYRAQTSEGVETSTFEVLHETKTIQGVQATVVHDRVYLDGDLIEDTFDWFSQDDAGNVWYLGEDSKEIENGQIVGTEGSWEWGVDGALPGVVMWADPSAHMDGEYRQEYSKGIAEDLAIVIGLNEDVAVPAGSFTGCLKSRERNGLEQGSVEYKYYCRDVGTVLGTDAAGGQRDELQEVSGP